jgi:heme o synthase
LKNFKISSCTGLSKIYFQLTRSTISAAVSFSAAIGYISRYHGFSASLLQTIFGVYFFSCAASVLNQYQEREQDTLMERTRYRPLPDHKIKPSTVLIIAAMNIIAGFLLLQKTGSLAAMMLACLNILWYNAVYTPLKKKTSFAVLIGAAAGAIPPIIGWTAAGGNIFNPVILSISSFLFMWQVSHFLLLFLKYSSDYRKAGFPDVFNTSLKQSYKVILFTWLLGTALCSILLILSGAVSGHILPVIVCTGNIIFLFYTFCTMFLKVGNTYHQRLIPLFYVYQAFILLIPVLSVI